MIEKAADFAQNKHAGQKDDTGQDYFFAHLHNVFKILQEITCDENILCAGLLHDTLEDTDTTFDELVKEFNIEIANLINEVTHDGQKDNDGYYFPRLKSKNAILIKFADRLSNLSRMESWNEKRQTQYINKSKFWKSEGKEDKIV